MAQARWPWLAALALLSAGGLLLEIGLTRLFSTLYYPPYVFVVLSLAVLGIGLGAAAASWRSQLRQVSQLPAYLALAGLATVVLTVFAIESASIELQLPTILLVVVPYFAIGLALATFFSSASAASHPLYLADLLGAGLGALLSIPILNWLAGIDGLLLAAAVFGLAGIAVQGRRFSIAPAAVITLAVLLIIGSRVGGWLTLDMTRLASEKPISESLRPNGKIIDTVWDSFARTDLVRPSGGGPYQLYLDGAAGSVMPAAQGSDTLLRDIGLFPFATARPESVFVIGPGGGLDVWFGLQSQAGQIVAVEVNPASVRLVERYGEYNGDLYDRAGVRVVVDEGRSVLRREEASYDLIFLSQVVTLAAERSGYALTENTIYTVEAFRDYFAHLEPEGQIAIKLYDEPTLARTLSTALAALRAQGLSDDEALRHTIALLDANSDPPIPLLMVRKSAYSQDESLQLGLVAQQVGFAPLYLPEVHAEPPLDSVEAGTVTFAEIAARSEADISPTTDDRPFFYQFERGLPRQLGSLLLGLAGVVVIGGGLVANEMRRVVAPSRRWAPLYFAGLGAGFMAIELSVIQQTRLFLGHPTLAVTTVLAVLLVGGGVGSGMAGRWSSDHGSTIPSWPALLVAALTVAWLVVWPQLGDRLLALEAAARVVVVAASLLPLALAMGIPFPTGLRAVGRGGDQHVALAWAVNGVMTVVGSAGAIAIAITVGFTAALVAGACAYAVAGIVASLAGGTARKGTA